MRSSNFRIAAAVLLTVGTGVSFFFTWKISEVMAAIDKPVPRIAHPPANAQEKGHVAVALDVKSNPILLSFDEMVANVGSSDNRNHLFMFKMDLELFDEEYRKLIEKRQGGVKHVILELARSQNMNELGTLSGKLYFKEQVIAALNGFLNQAAIRDIHFASFLLR